MKPCLPILLSSAALFMSVAPLQAAAQAQVAVGPQADIAALDAATALRPDTARPKNVILSGLRPR